MTSGPRPRSHRARAVPGRVTLQLTVVVLAMLAIPFALLALALPSDPAHSTGNPPASTPPPAEETHSKGRFRYQLLTGIEFSQDRDSFSEKNFLLRFSGDTSWRTGDGSYSKFRADNWRDIHTIFDLTMASVPAVDTANDFITSKKAVTFSFGLESRGLVLPVADDHVLTLGPLIRGGLQSLTDGATATEDIHSVSGFFGVGLRISDSGKWSLKEDDTLDFNPAVQRSVEVYRSHYDNLPGTHWTFDGLLKTDGPLFLGAKAIIGDGDDDVRVYAGLSLDVESLQKLLGLGGE